MLTQGSEDVLKLKAKADNLRKKVVEWRGKCFKEDHTRRSWATEQEPYTKEVLNSVNEVIKDIESAKSKIEGALAVCNEKLVRQDPS